MTDLVPKGGSFLDLLHQSGGAPMPVPYEREIFLFDTHVAGTTHVEDIEEIYPTLQIEEHLDFFREPENAYDKEAIRVQTAAGQKLGYVPKEDNVIFSRLMDAGKLLFGRIQSVEKQGNWVRIAMRIYLKG